MNDFSPYFQLFLSVSRRLESIAVRLGPPLSIEESQILTLIFAHQNSGPAVTAHDIGELLQIEKSSLSRKIKRLNEAGLLKRAKSGADKRAKLLELSDKGRKTLEADQAIRNLQTEEFSSPLSIPERRDLTRLVSVIASNLAAPEVSMGTSDHPLKIQIARLTRSLGFLGTSLFETGFPLEECQIFAMLSQKPAGMLLAELKESLPYDKSKMSRLIQSYELRGLISSRIDSGDKRRIFITLTKSGVAEAVAVQLGANRLFERGLGPLAPKERMSFQKYLERIVGNNQTRVDSPSITIRTVESENDRMKLRGFFIRRLAATGFEADAPASLAHPNSMLLASFEDSEITAGLEWSLKEDRVRIENLLGDSSHGTGTNAAALLQHLQKVLTPGAKIEFAPNYLIKLLRVAGFHSGNGTISVSQLPEISKLLSVG